MSRLTQIKSHLAAYRRTRFPEELDFPEDIEYMLTEIENLRREVNKLRQECNDSRLLEDHYPILEDE
jgi:HAMP domain-containing protein